MGLPVRRAILSKDVGQLQGWLRHGLWLALALAGVAVQVIERADGGGHDLWTHAGITRRGADALMAQQDLNDANVGAVLQKMCGEGVS